MKPTVLWCLAGALLAVCFAASTLAQTPTVINERAGSLAVYVADEYGKPLLVPVELRLRSTSYGAVAPIFPRATAHGGLFESLNLGDTYNLDVEAKGYQTVHQSIMLDYGGRGASQSVIIYMKPFDETLIFHAPSGQSALPPKAQKEVQNGLKDFQSNKFNAGEKHIAKALKIAPASPYVNLVAGMGYLLDQQLALAQPYLEKSVSFDSGQVAALAALGNLQFQKENYSAATRLLERAVEIDPASWKSQWILADCYLREQNYPAALDHAKQALESGQEKAQEVQLLLAEAYAGLGNHEAAKNTVQTFLARNPDYPTAPAIRTWVAALDIRSSNPVLERTALPLIPPRAAPAPAAEPLPKEDWAPEDIDAETPFVISGTACSLPSVLDMASKTAEMTATNLQEFEATEESEVVEVRRNKSLEIPQAYKTKYMAVVDRSDPKTIGFQELHEPPISPDDRPAGILDAGAPTLVLAFHPIYRDSFQWSCQGLGEWNSQPAWIVRFRQKPDLPTSLLSTFETVSQSYSLPLKGRAWVAANGGQVVHLETDLVAPVTTIGYHKQASILAKQHFVVDYAPVPFPSHQVTLWLPENVNLFLQYQNRCLHYYHHYSKFTLFWVGTSEKIGAPKEAKKQN